MGAIFPIFSEYQEAQKFELFSELNIHIFNLLEVVGIHYTFKHKWLSMDLDDSKVIAYAMGWTIAVLIVLEE